jgi:hypothetical protein
MADSTLKINVTTTADTSGFNSVTTATKQLTDEQRVLQSVAQRTGETFEQVQARFTQTATTANQATNQIKEVGTAAQAAASGATILGAALGAAIPTSMTALVIGVANAFREFERSEAAAFNEMEHGIAVVQQFQQSILAAQDAMRETALIKGLPLTEGIQRAQADVTKLKTEQSLVNLVTEEGVKEYEKYSQRIAAAQALADGLVKTQGRQTELIFQTKDQIDINLATGNEELTIQTKVKQAYDQKLQSLRDQRVPEADAVALADRYAESVRQGLEATRGAAGAQRTHNETLSEAQRILQSIRQQQQLIQGAPFMGADEKSAALLRNSVAEMRELERVINDLQRQKAGVALDPAALDQVNAKLQTAVFRFQQLGQEVAKLQAPLRTELTNWAASFGTTAQQIGKTIEGTIGAALQSVNQFLVTGKFNAQALLQQLILLGLQLAEQMIIQRIMAAINAAAAAGQAAVTGPLVAAAWAPAATAATIATQGAAAAQAPAAIAGALALIQGMFIAHEGGEVPIIAQSGEIIIRRNIAQPNRDFLLGLNSGKFQSGGSGGGGGGVHIYAFTDLKQLTKHMGSREGQKIIFDTVNGRRIDLGIGK